LSLLKPVHIENKWLVVFQRRDKYNAEYFVRICRKYAKTMEIGLQIPRLVQILTSNTDDFVTAIKNNFDNEDKIIVVITPGNIEIKERYDAIKKFCTVQLGIPTQIIRSA